MPSTICTVTKVTKSRTCANGSALSCTGTEEHSTSVRMKHRRGGRGTHVFRATAISPLAARPRGDGVRRWKYVISNLISFVWESGWFCDAAVRRDRHTCTPDYVMGNPRGLTSSLARKVTQRLRASFALRQIQRSTLSKSALLSRRLLVVGKHLSRRSVGIRS